MLIGISGKIGSGKDTVGKIIQYLVWKSRVEKGELPSGKGGGWSKKRRLCKTKILKED